MPIYEYRCPSCKRKVSIFWRTFGAVNDAAAECPHCGGRNLARLVSRVRVIRGGGSASAGDGAANDDALVREMSGLDENDPRAMGRFMRKMAAESGEDMPAEFDEMVGRLEKGESIESVEKDMGDAFGPDPMGGMGGMDDDVMGALPPNTTAEADKKAEAADKKKTEKKKSVAVKSKAKTKKTAKK
ncbi:MAG TPA: zinc ribbon domain-containing protein [Thermoflexales bacterium]|nr:zinc ribbon domain-containing protein [Thermoflexales bacterium]HRA00803.1 zinc ribbon domain-containing protein [Thermoflexales bacterium]